MRKYPKKDEKAFLDLLKVELFELFKLLIPSKTPLASSANYIGDTSINIEESVLLEVVCGGTTPKQKVGALMELKLMLETLLKKEKFKKGSKILVTRPLCLEGKIWQFGIKVN